MVVWYGSQSTKRTCGKGTPTVGTLVSNVLLDIGEESSNTGIIQFSESFPMPDSPALLKGLIHILLECKMGC